MYDYISGDIIELSPAELILDNNGIGYKFQISLNSYSKFREHSKAKIYIHHHLREDEELFYGFFTKEERHIFTLLISVSGIGPNTARMMLSSMTPEEIQGAIISGDVNTIKSIKGIGLKTAQRVIIELKDKIIKGASSGSDIIFDSQSNNIRNEATSALVLLGFSKNNIEKVLSATLKSKPNATLEELIKLALKQL